MTTYAGTSATSSADHFTYNSVTAPTVTSLSSDTGTTGGGTAFTIGGTGFLNATTAVDIDGSPVALFVVLNDSSIYAVTAPNTAGTFDVTVTGPGGTSALSSSDRFTFEPAPAPTVTSLSSDTATTAGGTLVTITGTDLTGAGGVFFGSVPATSFIVNSSGTSIAAYSPSQGAGIVDITVTTPTGTSAVSSSDTFTYSNAAAPTVTGRSLTGGSTAGGITVTVIGSHFTGATQAFFGTVPVSVHVLNDDYLTVVVPGHAAGTVDITVETPSGTSSTSSADTFTYTAASGPSVTSVSSNSGLPQGGNAIVVLGSGFTGATSVHFASTAATFTVLSDSALLVTVPGPMSTGTDDVTVTTPVGTSSTSSADHYTYTGALVLDGVNGLTVSGMTLANGIEIIDSTNITLLGNTIGIGYYSYTSSDGISVDAASSNITIGGTGAGQGNTILFSGKDGVYIAGSNVILLGNDIIYSGNGGSYDGVDVASGANDITIGGTASGAGNTINSSSGHGVYVDGTNVTIQRNTIYSNSHDGIDVASGASTVTIGGATLATISTLTAAVTGSRSRVRQSPSATTR